MVPLFSTMLVNHSGSGERKPLAYLEPAAVQLCQLLNRDDHWAALAVVVDNLLALKTLGARTWRTLSGSGSGEKLSRKPPRRRNKSCCRRIVCTVGKKTGEPSRVFCV